MTREELRQVLWPDGEHVDYDHSISNNISRLRAILRDNLSSPAYIATVSKRGYRFIATVHTSEAEAALPSSVSSETLAASEPPVIEPVPPLGEAPPPSETPLSLIRPVIQLEPARLLLGLKRRSLITIPLLAIPLLVLAVLGVERSWRVFFPPPAPVSQDIYLAVAPFDASSGDRALAESFRLDLVDAVSMLPGVRVTAAHSFSSGKIDEPGILRLGQEQHLDVVLLGKSSQEGRNCTFHFELVRARDATHLGSFSYSATVDDLPAIRDRIQSEIFARLDLVRYATHPISPPATDRRAYEFYLRGRYDLAQQTNESLQRAVQEFQSSSSVDPHFARALAGLANAYVSLADHDVITIQEGYGRARDVARKVVAMDPTLPEGHGLLGYTTLGLNWNLSAAEAEISQAVQLDPSSARYHLWLSVLLAEEGRFDESYRQIDLAHAMDPYWPATYITEAFVASSARDSSRMLAAASKLVKLKPDWPLSYDQMAWTDWYAGRHEDAIRQWLTMAQLEGDSSRIKLEQRGLAEFQRGGTVAYARLHLTAMGQKSNWNHKSHDFVFPEWYSCAGEPNLSIQALQEMIDHHDSTSLTISVNPIYDGLRADPRFQSLLAQVYGVETSKQITARLNARFKTHELDNIACPIDTRHATPNTSARQEIASR